MNYPPHTLRRSRVLDARARGLLRHSRHVEPVGTSHRASGGCQGTDGRRWNTLQHVSKIVCVTLIAPDTDLQPTPLIDSRHIGKSKGE